MNPFVLYIMLLSLGLGTTLTFASSHWLMAWMGLEINTLAIIPLMIQQYHPRAVEASIKYFLTQAMAATLMLFLTTSNAWVTGQWDIQHLSHPALVTMTALALGLKMGLAPLHFWLPEVMQGLNLYTGMLLITWQKLAPMMLIYQLAPQIKPPLIMALAVLSALIGGWGGLNQTQLRKIMAYSSIAHMGWMMAVIKYAPDLMMLNLIIYIVLTCSIFMTINMISATKINNLAVGWSKTPTFVMLMIVILLSLGGLPPLTGFMPKWLIMQELTKQMMPMMATLMAMAALISLFFYLRVCYGSSLTTSPNTNNALTPWRLKSMIPSTLISSTSVATTMLLPLTPTILMIVSW
uniref:NADH-ubiquinone oxidoreductase chain 2 n=1 Tax=Saccopharynx lavenbergi TaxID=136490 RepID=Q76MH0_9TELE|nr:NADH dehydrogenase subunits 2 [Saccopharynx lavenbergi]